MLQKLPVGIQTFEEIIGKDYLYIDKTEAIHRLIMSGKYYFLSRPRRFGKSLTLSTLKAIFSGKRELFKGLWIENQRDWDNKHPVIHLSFSSIGYKTLGLEAAISAELQTRLGIALARLILRRNSSNTGSVPLNACICGITLVRMPIHSRNTSTERCDKLTSKRTTTLKTEASR